MDQNYQNMTIIKVALLFLYSLMKKKLRRIRSISDIDKWLWKSEFCCFRPSILKQPKDQKYFYGRFHSSLAYSTLNSHLWSATTLDTLNILWDACIYALKFSLNHSGVFFYDFVGLASIICLIFLIDHESGFQAGR